MWMPDATRGRLSCWRCRCSHCRLLHLHQRHQPATGISHQSGWHHTSIGKHHRNGSGRRGVIIWFQSVIDGIRGNGLIGVVMPRISRIRPIRPLFQTIVNAGTQLIQWIGHYIGGRSVMSRTGNCRYGGQDWSSWGNFIVFCTA